MKWRQLFSDFLKCNKSQILLKHGEIFRQLLRWFTRMGLLENSQCYYQLNFDCCWSNTLVFCHLVRAIWSWPHLSNSNQSAALSLVFHRDLYLHRDQVSISPIFYEKLLLRGHSNNTWHFLAYFRPPLPRVSFGDTNADPPPWCDVTNCFWRLQA